MSHRAAIEASYLGWLPVDSTTPAISVLNELLSRQLQPFNGQRSAQCRRHRLTVSEKSGCLTLTEFDEADARGGRNPAAMVPFADIDWVGLHPRDLLVFGIVLNGYNEDSNCFIHAHAWRCDGASYETVAKFASCLAAAADAADAAAKQQQQQQQQQPAIQKPAEKFCLHPHAQSDALGSECAQTFARNGVLANQHLQQQQQQPAINLGSMAHSLAHELRNRLDNRGGDGAPLLHPPRDYDTLRRSHGNARLRCSEQPLAHSSQAPNGAYIRRQSIVRLSDIDEPEPDYDDGMDDRQNRPCQQQQLNRSSGGSSAAPSPMTVSGGGSSGKREGAAFLDEDEGDEKWADPRLGFSAWTH